MFNILSSFFWAGELEEVCWRVSEVLSRRWPAWVPGEEGVGHVHRLLKPPPPWPCTPAPHPSAAKHTLWWQGECTHSGDSAHSGSLPSSQAVSEGREGSAERALKTVKSINDLVNDSFYCILIISLYKGNFWKTGDWARTTNPICRTVYHEDLKDRKISPLWKSWKKCSHSDFYPPSSNLAFHYQN